MAQAQRTFAASAASKPQQSTDTIASSLVNPASGIANDYLNLFNEIIMLIEQLPSMPELIDDIKAWRPTTYREYFASSPLPGRSSALEAYEKLDLEFRTEFEKVVADLDQQATGIVAAIRLHQRAKMNTEPFALEVICERGGASLRETLERAVAIVNEGIKGLARNARLREERLRKIREQAIKDVEEFRNNRWANLED